jgi:hypothetical protein
MDVEQLGQPTTKAFDITAFRWHKQEVDHAPIPGRVAYCLQKPGQNVCFVVRGDILTSHVGMTRGRESMPWAVGSRSFSRLNGDKKSI